MSLPAAVPWETVAVVLSLAYLVLAARERVECWFAAMGSVLIYYVILVDVQLYMEAGLQVFYGVMAVYGYLLWRRSRATGGDAERPRRDGREPLRIATWQPAQHAAALTAIAAGTVLSGYLLTRYTDAAYPYLDAFTTCGALVTTFMVARKILENWLYWIVIDAAGVYLFLARGLEQTAVLFALYVLLAAYGYLDWRRRLVRQGERAAA